MDPCLIRTDSGIKHKKQAGIVRHTVLLAVMASVSDGQFVPRVACRVLRSQDRPQHFGRTGAPAERQREHAVHNGTGQGRSQLAAHATRRHRQAALPLSTGDR